MKNAHQAEAIRKMYESIDSNPLINEAYTLLDLVKEANALEQHHYESGEYVDFMPFYENLLKRMNSYATVNQLNLSLADRYALTMLYTTIASKVARIRSNPISDSETRIIKFFDLMVKNVEAFHESGRLSTIQELQNHYNSDIMERIRRTDGYIQGDIQPGIERLFTTLNGAMQKLIDESIQLQGNASEHFEQKAKIGNSNRS